MAGNEGTIINIEQSRIVWGHPLKGQQKKDPATKQIVLKDGQPIIQHVFGLAIPKEATIRAQYAGQPNVDEIVRTVAFEYAIWPLMAAEAAKGFPSGVPNAFSWKLDDGDGIDSGGKPFAEREGYAGHWILTVASNTGFPPSLYRFNGTNYDQLTENDVKTGDYIAAQLKVLVNIPTLKTHTPSLYVNPDVLEFLGHGKEIVSNGVNPMAAFGGRQRVMPVGASAAPVGGGMGGGVALPGAAPMQQQPYQQQPAPQYQQQAPAPQYAPQPAPQMPGNGNMGTPMPGAPVAVQNPPQYAQQPMQPGYGASPSDPQQQYQQQAPAPQYAPQPAPQMPAPHQQFVQPGAPVQQQPMPGGAPMGGGMPGMPGPR